MARYIFRIAPIIVFGFALVFFDRVPAHSDSTERRTDVVYDASYRSHSPTHKVIVQSNQNELRDSVLAEGGQVLVDYGAFTLMSSPLASAGRVGAEAASGSSVRDDMNLLLLRAGAFDTTQGDVASANSLAEPDLNEQQLYLVQFIGPIKNQWLNDLRSDAEIVGYIPNNAYLIRATGD